MKPITIYALKSSKKDEKIIVKNVNEYLALDNRTMSKTKTTVMLKKYLPLVLPYYYWNLNKSKGTYFEIFSNEDKEGNFFYEKHTDYAWIIKTFIDVTHPMYNKQVTESFLMEILNVAGFEYFVLEEKTEH